MTNNRTAQEMVERLGAWSIDDIQQTPRNTFSLIDEAATLIASQAEENERACADHANATIGWERERSRTEEAEARALAAEAALAKAVEASLHHESGERITRKDLNNAFRQGQENGRAFAMLFDGGPDFLTCARTATTGETDAG